MAGPARILDELLTLETNSYVPAGAIAAVYIGLGELERALDWIERGYVRRDSDLVLLKTFSLWDPLRGNPRFERIVSADGVPSMIPVVPSGTAGCFSWTRDDGPVCRARTPRSGLGSRQCALSGPRAILRSNPGVKLPSRARRPR